MRGQPEAINTDTELLRPPLFRPSMRRRIEGPPEPRHAEEAPGTESFARTVIQIREERARSAVDPGRPPPHAAPRECASWCLAHRPGGGCAELCSPVDCGQSLGY